MCADLVAEIAARQGPVVVLSPHLDDAVLSCGELIARSAAHTEITVVTLFTEAGAPPYTISARRYLHQVGAVDAQVLYQQRRAEDRAVLRSAGARWVHAGLPDALHRRRPVEGTRRRLSRLLPELAHVYPAYRPHVVSGRIAPSDAETLRAVCQLVARVASGNPAVILAPLAVGGHVDHVLARTAAEASGACVVYYSDFPYNRRHRADREFIERHALVESRPGPQTEPITAAKARLIRAYRTQAHALFPDGFIPPTPEIYFCPASLAVPSLNGGPGGDD